MAVGTVASYTAFTVTVSNWRTEIRKEMNRAETAAGGKIVDSLINYETVKLFSNEVCVYRRIMGDQPWPPWMRVIDAHPRTPNPPPEPLPPTTTRLPLGLSLPHPHASLWASPSPNKEHEAARLDESLQKFQRASIQTQTSLSALNFGQVRLWPAWTRLLNHVQAHQPSRRSPSARCALALSKHSRQPSHPGTSTHPPHAVAVVLCERVHETLACPRGRRTPSSAWA